MKDPEERVDHLRKAAKFFSEHKDRLLESKVSCTEFELYVNHLSE